MSIQSHFRPLRGPAWSLPLRFLYRLGWSRPRLVLAATATSALLGLVEGVGLTLLIPLLGLLGLDAGATPEGPVRAIVDGFRYLDLPLNVSSVLAVFAVAAVLQTALHSAQQYFVVAAGENMTFSLRAALFGTAGRADWPFVLSLRSGNLQAMIVTEAQRIGVIFGNSISAAGLVVLFLIYVTLAAWLSWKFTAILFTVFVVATLALRVLYASSRRFGAFSSSASTRMQELLSEHLRAAKLLRIAGAQAWSERLFQSAAGDAGTYTRKHQVNNILVRASMEPLALLALIAILYLSFTQSVVPPAQSLVFIAIFYRLVPRMVQLQQLVQRITATLPSYELIGGMFAQLEAHPVRCGGKPYDGLREGIEVEDLVVEADGQRIIDASSFRIPVRSFAALIGPSGAGKSTLVDVMLGLRPYASGSIRYDGLPIEQIDLASLRRRVGYVPQDAQFFHDSVGANLRLARTDLGDGRLWEVLERAQAAEFVRQMPRGLETVIGAQGLRLSGGQRQRLALARALVDDPDLLILDEPTSALDAETEEALLADLLALRGKITIIVIAHGESLRRHCDLRLRFSNGRIVTEA